MIYLLDTNVCIKYLNGRAPKVRERLRSHRPDEIRVCSVVKAEMFAGAQKSTAPTQSLTRQLEFFAPFTSLPFDDVAAEFYSRIRASLEKSGTTISPYDLQIAAIALANNCTLVTNNTAEFGRVVKLVIEDWEL